MSDAIRDAIRALVAALGAGSYDLGSSMQRHSADRRADATEEARARRALEQIMARQTDGPEWGPLTPGEDEDGPGMFQQNRVTGQVRRAVVTRDTVPPAPPKPDVPAIGTPPVPSAPAVVPAVTSSTLKPPTKTAATRPPTQPELVAVDEVQPDGTTKRVMRPKREGLVVSSPSNIASGSAQLKKATAENRTMASTIQKAMDEVKKYPKAFGLTRGLPIIGDRLDARADPEGVAARSLVANIGSLKVHDRSGAAVSIHEFPRLAPFIPNIYDPPEKILINLQQLLDELDKYNLEIEQSTAIQPSASSGPADTKPKADVQGIYKRYNLEPKQP